MYLYFVRSGKGVLVTGFLEGSVMVRKVVLNIKSNGLKWTVSIKDVSSSRKH